MLILSSHPLHLRLPWLFPSSQPYQQEQQKSGFSQHHLQSPQYRQHHQLNAVPVTSLADLQQWQQHLGPTGSWFPSSRWQKQAETPSLQHHSLGGRPIHMSQVTARTPLIRVAPQLGMQSDSSATVDPKRPSLPVVSHSNDIASHYSGPKIEKDYGNGIMNIAGNHETAKPHGQFLESDAQRPKESNVLSQSYSSPVIPNGVGIATNCSATIATQHTTRHNLNLENGQTLDPGRLSPPISSLCSTDGPLPLSVPETEKTGDDIHPNDDRSNTVKQHSQIAEINVMSEYLSRSSASSTAVVPYAALRVENSLVPCTDPKKSLLQSSTGAVLTESPAWLPPGWVTEIQVRRTGTTAGTRDKYYKDLVSGRRFRSRNEVIHFLKTGKGRIRFRSRRRAPGTSALRGAVYRVAHQKQGLTHKRASFSGHFLPSEPADLVLSLMANTSSAKNLPAAVAPIATVKVEAPCQVMLPGPGPGNGPAMFGLEQTIGSRLQNMPINKKVKAFSPKRSEDKQASRFLQWLQKAESRVEQQPEKQGCTAGESNTRDIESQGRVGYHQEKQSQNFHWTFQLGKDVDTAQGTINKLTNEMQIMIGKLIGTIQEAKMKLKLEDGGTHGSDDAIREVMTATKGLENAVDNLSGATQRLALSFDHSLCKAQTNSSCVASMPRTYKHSQDVAMCAKEKVLGPDAIMLHSASDNPSLVTEGLVCAEENLIKRQLFSDSLRINSSGLSHVHDTSGPCLTQAAPLTTCHASSTVEHRAFATPLDQSLNPTVFHDLQNVQDGTNAANCGPIDMHQSHFLLPTCGLNQLASSKMLIVEKVDEHMCEYPKGFRANEQIAKPGNRRTRAVDFASADPKLALSILDPSLTSRKRAKMVQRLKAKHARGLLAILGRKVCLKAIQKSLEENRIMQC
ncbi:hypothetical protein KP509_05G032000 [Ceratopteris richardii]|uniref:MBD domain-containing protein n=1 Tax=Ceratopteris richardii TaxID=49495 RepID=A0A8T2USD9_CERRI|nr:hypothetical protein KP509_05G032000 [Ceratopteris richardii]